MDTKDIIKLRLINQQITQTKYTKPKEIVSWLTVMQAQDFAMAKWAIGLRLPQTHESDIEQAFNKGEILRTHLLRPTWHFVTPADIRWILLLTAPHVKAVSSYMNRKLELDNKIFRRSDDVLGKILEGGKQLTRDIIRTEISKARIKANNLQLIHLLMRAELDGIICSGARRDKQFTYALLDERAAPPKSFNHEEALNELTRRYFTTRGPATLQDFSWWSGFAMNKLKVAATMLRHHFMHEEIDGKEYFFSPEMTGTIKKSTTTFLLPDYDEYGISYKDRTAIFGNQDNAWPARGGNAIFNHAVIVDGTMKGTWQRTATKKSLQVSTSFFTPLNKRQKQELTRAIQRYQSFWK